MSGELVYEIARYGAGADAEVLTQSWLRLSFIETDSTVSGHGSTELGLATPAVAADAGQLDPRVDNDEPAVRVWRRDGTSHGDAQIVLSWLRGNTLADCLEVDTDMLVHLFIEATVNNPQRSRSWDGEYLATLAGTGAWVGTTSTARWAMTVNLAPEVVGAVLDAIADSGPQWRYAIVAARDPESPAGRVRRKLLDDIGR